MDRRHFISRSAAWLVGGAVSRAAALTHGLPACLERVVGLSSAAAEPSRPWLAPDFRENRSVPKPRSTVAPRLPADPQQAEAAYKEKMRAFNNPHGDDMVLGRTDLRLLKQCKRRLDRVKKIVGHSNLYLLSFDDAVGLARSYSQVGAFSAAELAFLEKIFYIDAAVLGFFGDKPVSRLTQDIAKKDVVKIPGSANYLFKGAAESLYRRMRKDIGDKAVLTSGIRNVVKQFHLFLSKAVACDGNLSLASRSIAPPGYSYHGISDFDIGKVGYGSDNFSDRFTRTDVYQALLKLDYVHLRYPQENRLGVRFEPWHIQVGPV